MTTYSDTFTDNNNKKLEVHDASWVNVSGGANSITIQSNQARQDVTGFCAYRYNQTVGAAQFSEVTWVAVTGAGPGPAIRMQSGSEGYFYSFHFNTDLVFNGEMVAGSPTDWDSGLSLPTNGDTIRLESDPTTSTTIYYKVNGSTVQTYTGKSNLSGGQVGIAGYSDTADIGLWDNWQGGDVSGGSVTLSAVIAEVGNTSNSTVNVSRSLLATSGHQSITSAASTNVSRNFLSAIATLSATPSVDLINILSAASIITGVTSTSNSNINVGRFLSSAIDSQSNTSASVIDIFRAVSAILTYTSATSSSNINALRAILSLISSVSNTSNSVLQIILAISSIIGALSNTSSATLNAVRDIIVSSDFISATSSANLDIARLLNSIIDVLSNTSNANITTSTQINLNASSNIISVTSASIIDIARALISAINTLTTAPSPDINVLRDLIAALNLNSTTSNTSISIADYLSATSSWSSNTPNNNILSITILLITSLDFTSLTGDTNLGTGTTIVGLITITFSSKNPNILFQSSKSPDILFQEKMPEIVFDI